MMTKIYTTEAVPAEITKSIFLAGPSLRADQQNKLISWRIKALQILETLGYDDLRNQIMKSKSIKYIRTIASKIKRALPNTKEVWKNILNQYYLQNSTLRDMLIKTKNTILVFANDIPYLGGIGFEKASGEEIIDPTKWKTFKIGDVIITSNIVGNILMEIRNEMKEEEIEEKDQTGGEVKESYKTDEEREKQKKAAIINYIRKK
jgi:predicted NAD-dependent protein-ADP-ribosyltransferase YbiA (DUF1768 family)